MSELALGCEQLGGTDWGHVDIALARRAVRCALDHGITTFDTADVYGLGRSEEELARALAEDRHRVTIITKGGVRWTSKNDGGRAATCIDASPRYLRRAIEASLRRLRIARIPLYLLHWPDPTVLIDDSLACLEKAQSDGLIGAYGLSNVPPATVSGIATRSSVSAFEGPLSLLSPVGTERLYRDVRVRGVRTLAYGPLAQGFLTGRYSAASTFDPTDRRSRLPHYSSASWRQHAPILQTLAEVARETGYTPAQVAIRWVMDTGAASTIVVGARAPEQILSSVETLSWSLDAAQMRSLFASRRRALSPKSHEQGGAIAADV